MSGPTRPWTTCSTVSDAIRRDILRRCGRDESAVSRLASTYPMSFAAVQKHVAVLERAGLVTKKRRGPEQLVRTDRRPYAGRGRYLDGSKGDWRAPVEPKPMGALPSMVLSTTIAIH